ncbi:MAG: hypothetical protein IPL73_19890 [Candidatus Obscuribacter sp.]|nr:hypothetical protein [Candidatus Obscuribacter sp.]
MRSKIRHQPVPLMAEQANIQGYNQTLADEDEAAHIRNWSGNIPTLEGPYGNLARF